MAKPENIMKVARALLVAQGPRYMVPLAGDPLSVGYREAGNVSTQGAPQESRTLVARPKEERDGPTLLGVSGATIAASGFPLMDKPRRANGTVPHTAGATGKTSALSRITHSTGLNEMFLEKPVWTPMFGNLGAKSRKVATVVARRAPVIGHILAGADVVGSDNKLRTAVGNAAGLAGSAIGTVVGGGAGLLLGGVGAVPGAIAGNAGFGYLGNEAGLAIYDYLADE